MPHTRAEWVSVAQANANESPTRAVLEVKSTYRRSSTFLVEVVPQKSDANQYLMCVITDYTRIGLTEAI